jgi:hypothetical protein
MITWPALRVIERHVAAPDERELPAIRVDDKRVAAHLDRCRVRSGPIDKRTWHGALDARLQQRGVRMKVFQDNLLLAAQVRERLIVGGGVEEPGIECGGQRLPTSSTSGWRLKGTSSPAESRLKRSSLPP